LAILLAVLACARNQSVEFRRHQQLALVAASGTHDFLAPESIRSDQFIFRGARLPYAKFPRDPGP
jgi:hypothetical protein